ncbi:tumor necrosis factor receptor superfamily member 22-like [Hyperolius riggenbachi]|uniref:tumor necrosis factor receptor superfamily member 22-like n=1 Tax=Hyperolius riggenbachi TaxID=752182 RepID=UPI0035A2FE59
MLGMLLLSSCFTAIYSYPNPTELMPSPPLLQADGNKQILCSETEYRLSPWICCQKCPAGTHVSADCSTNHGTGACRNCMVGKTFTAYANGLNACLSCRSCRQDEVSIHECSSTSDAICQCKPGTYLCQQNMNCSNTGTCVQCTSCPPGQRETHGCNATSDTVCEEDIVSSSLPKTFSKEAIIVLAVVAAILIVTPIVFIIVRRRQSDTGKTISTEEDKEDITENGENPEERPESQDSVTSYTELLRDTEEISGRVRI